MDQVSKASAIGFIQEFIPGYVEVSLTNHDNTSEPAIAAGSRLEISQEGYSNSIEEAITGWGAISNDTQAYIKLVPSGAEADPEFTDVVPTFNEAKAGWYDGNDRYIFSVYKTDATTYTDKLLLKNRHNYNFSEKVHIEGRFTTGLIKGVVDVPQSSTQVEWFNLFNPYFSASSKMRRVRGVLVASSNTGEIMLTMFKQSSTLIVLDTIDDAGDPQSVTMNSASASVVTRYGTVEIIGDET